MTQKKEYNWSVYLFLATYQILLLISLPFYFYYAPPSLSMILASIVLLYLTGLSITGGYHRYFSHRSYKAHPAIQAILLFFGAMAGQGSALRWSYDHRIHHAYVDTDNDPYSIQKGFWYAHFGWILDKPRVIDSKVVPDLLKDKMVMFQHNNIGLAMLGTNLVAFIFVGWLLNDFVGAFFMALWLRLFALHHFTWFINSLAHTWGDKPFCQEQTAVNNFIISLLTFGEGYHNYHHTFANDYRNGVRWYQWDPTKWLIWTLNKFGLAHSLKRMDAYTIQKRLVMERKNLLMQRISTAWENQKEELEKQINEISESITNKINQFVQLMEKYRELKNESKEYQLLQEIRAEIKSLKRSMKQDWRTWKELSRTILNGKMAAA